MNALRPHLHWIARLALLALLALAFVPTLSRAMAAGDAGGPWAEVCSSTGVKPLTESAPAGGAAHLDHCPLCVLQQGLLVLPAVETGFALPADRAMEAPARLRPAPPPLIAWACAQPRGPPATS